MADPVTNETLAVKIDALRDLIEQDRVLNRERHRSNTGRLEEISADVKETRDEAKATNGRLRKVENRQASDLGRFHLMQQQFDTIANPHGKRAVIVKFGSLAGLTGLLAWLWKWFH